MSISPAVARVTKLASDRRWRTIAKPLDVVVEVSNAIVETTGANFEGLDEAKEGIDATVKGLDEAKEGIDATVKGLDEVVKGLDTTHKGLNNATE